MQNAPDVDVACVKDTPPIMNESPSSFSLVPSASKMPALTTTLLFLAMASWKA